MGIAGGEVSSAETTQLFIILHNKQQKILDIKHIIVLT